MDKTEVEMYCRDLGKVVTLRIDHNSGQQRIFCPDGSSSGGSRALIAVANREIDGKAYPSAICLRCDARIGME